MFWYKITEAEFEAMPLEERRKIRQGIPCPWCNLLIEHAWDQHCKVENDKTICTCPHCSRGFMMVPRETEAQRCCGPVNDGKDRA
jgi:hypothetical protein